MAITFPASPNANQTFTEGSITYKYDGAKWVGVGLTPADRLVEGSNVLEIDSNNHLIWTGGDVGLGSSTINQQSGGRTVLSIDGTNNALLNFNHSNTLAGFMYGANDEFRMESNGTRPLIFRANSETRLTITSTGTQESFADYTASATNTFASWARTGGAIRAEVGYNAVTLDYMYFGTGTLHPLALRTNSNTALLIDNSQRVLIGTGDDLHTQGQLTVKNENDFSTASVSTNTDNIWLISDATSGDGAYGASIGFSRVQYSDRRAAAIATVQEGTDEDKVGLAFFTHDNADASQPVVESLRIGHKGLVTAKAFYPTYGSTGFRNLWYNGNMSVAQRLDLKGVTSAAGDGFIHIDRYYTHQSGGAMSVSRELLGPGDDIEGSTYFMRVTTSTASDYSVMRLPIEDVRTIDGGEPITVSFWAKYVTNAPNGGLAMWFQTNYGEGGTATGSTAQQYFDGNNNMPELSTSWAKYSITFTDFPTLTGKTIGAGSHVEFLFGQGVNSSSTAWTLDITNIQIERGYSATPFERVDPSIILQHCQRYFHGEKFEDQRDSESSLVSEYLLTTGVGYTTTRVLAHLYWPTTMRARPYDIFSGSNSMEVLTTGGTWVTSSSVSCRSSRYGARLDITTGSAYGTAGQPVEVRLSTPNTGWFGVCAEMPIAVNSNVGGVYS